MRGLGFPAFGAEARPPRATGPPAKKSAPVTLLRWNQANPDALTLGIRTQGVMHMPDKQQRSNRGFASMDQNKQRDIARKGGESVPNEKRSFSRDPKLAAEAGRKGGRSVAPEARSFSRDPKLAAEAGRKGGEASHSRRNSDQNS